MYYYIFESSRDNKRLVDLEDKIKDYIRDLGIAGEITSLNYSQNNLDVLISQAIEKRYYTIVAVGGLKHITIVASHLVGSTIVFGMIPVENYPSLNQILHIKNWQDAALALKPRLSIEARLGIIMPGEIIFLTDCQIVIKKNGGGSILFSKYKVDFKEAAITVKLSNTGHDLIFQIESTKKPSIFNLWNLSNEKKVETSVFADKKAHLTTKPILPVVIDNIEIAQTPVSFSLSSKPLRMIVGKKI